MTEEATKFSAYYFKNSGRYNLCSNEKQWCVHLRTSGGNFSETWDIGDEPDVDGLLPSEVLALIESRLRSWWISTRREETLAKMDEWRKNAARYDLAWLQARLQREKKAVAETKDRIAGLRDDYYEKNGKELS